MMERWGGQAMVVVVVVMVGGPHRLSPFLNIKYNRLRSCHTNLVY